MRLPLFFIALSLVAEGRQWTLSNGRKVEADLVGYEKNFVLMKVKGKEHKVHFDKFSTQDQEYLRKYEPELGTHPEEGDAKMAVNEAEAGEQGDQADAEANWDAPWPGNVKTPDDIEIIEQGNAKDPEKWVYLSPHYKFICDVRLSKSVVLSFARLFEATHASMEAIPFNFQRALSSDPSKRHEIQLFETEETYAKNGGPPGSAGVFVGGRDGGVVMVPLPSIGVKKFGSGYTRDRDRTNETLPHELVHQLTDYQYYAHGSRGWFTEGIAEYVATSQMSDTRFNFSSNLDEIVAYATEYGKKDQGGRALGDEINLPDLKYFMLQPYSAFTANSNYNYGMGLLITTYFIHLEDGGSRENLVAFLKAMKDGKSGEELLEVLRAGRTWEELADDISAGWRRKGVKIEIGTN